MTCGGATYRYRTLPWLLIVSLAPAVLAGCGGGGQRGHTFRTETGPNGLPIAVSSGVPKYAEPVVRFTEVVRIRQNEQQPESLLNRPGRFRRGPDGNFYVVDAGNSRLAVFGPDGIYRRAFGRSGGGPGEFRPSPFGAPLLQSIDEQGLVVYDPVARRLTRFDLDGTFRETIPNRASFMAQRMWLAKDRIVYAGQTSFMSSEGASTSRTHYTVTSLEGDTLQTMTSAGEYQPGLVQLSWGGMARAPRFYAPRADICYCPGTGFVMWDGSRTDLQIFDPVGNPVRTVRLELVPVPVTAADREGVRALYRQEAEEAEDAQGREYFETEIAHATFADIKPFFDQVVLDENGYLWLHGTRDETQQDPEAALCVRLLSPAGEYLGDAVLPRGAKEIHDGLVYAAVSEEETGEEHLIAFRIESAVPGFTYP